MAYSLSKESSVRGIVVTMQFVALIVLNVL